MQTAEATTERKLNRHLSARAAWAFALGTSIGWGSLVVTSNTYLAEAGPWGSTLGMILGTLIMLLISRNYAYMMNCYPEAGGAYAYSREVFGHDHSFLTAWFLALTYLAILWANTTALPLFARYFLGSVFEFGKLYTIFGYDVYIGEAILSIAALLLVAFLCVRYELIMDKAMIVMVAFFSAAIVFCFAAGISHHGPAFTPAFIPGRNALSQTVKIAVISPWAFIGFENISHLTEEISFQKSRGHRILVIAVLCTTVLYVFVTLLSVSAYPPEYSSWLEYIRDLGNRKGIEGLPAFYASHHYLGQFGVAILMIALLCLIATSLIGNITALSRLFYALGRDRILPEKYGRLNEKGVPADAIRLIAIISVFIPFIGRTAIGWIVDVTTLGATLIYGFVSAAAMKLAARRQDRTEKITGCLGLAIMIGFGLYLLVPNLFTTGSMETETYFLFVAWSVLGFIFFRVVLRRDKEKRFGKSIIVWVALLSLILFVSLVWMSQSIMRATSAGLTNIENYYASLGIGEADSSVVAQQMETIRQISSRSIVVVVGLFAMSLSILLNNYSLMSKKAEESESQLGKVRDLANTDPLTGVKSKHAYLEKEKEINAVISSGNAEPFAVAVCDVNGLKLINDTLGHKAGDEYIRAASLMICEAFSHSPVYRIGGDEFVAFLSGRDYAGRKEILSYLHDRSVEHIGTGGVVVSVGMSEYMPEKDSDLQSVFERADALMYAEKKALKAMGAAAR